MKKASWITIVLALSICFSCLSGCYEATHAETESETGTNADAETESDTNTNTDAETESDTNTNTDAETESIIDIGNISGKTAAELLLAHINLDDEIYVNDLLMDEANVEEIKRRAPTKPFCFLSEGKPEDTNRGDNGCTYENNILEWSEFPLHSTCNVDKEKHIDIIQYYTTMCANLIQTIKQEVNVTDKWIRFNDLRLLLSVDENCEVLLIESGKQYGGDFDDEVIVCRRYVNDGGQDVYEMYIVHFMDNVNGDPLYESVNYRYLKFIDGYWYEFVETVSQAYAGEQIYYWSRASVLERLRGYWNLFSMSHTGTPTDASSGFSFANVTYKDNLIYKIIGGLESLDAETWVPISYSIGTNDTNLIEYSPSNGGSCTINGNAFSNIASIRIESPVIQGMNTDPSIQNPNVYCWDFEDDRPDIFEGVFETYKDDFQIVLNDGNVIDKVKFDTFVDGEVALLRVDTDFLDSGVYNATLAFGHYNTFIESNVNIYDFATELVPAIEMLGLEIADFDIDFTEALDEARLIGEHFKDHLEWNGYHLNTMDNISLSFVSLHEVQEELYSKYLAMKDNEEGNPKDYSIDFIDKIDFANILEMGVSNIEIRENEISIQDLYVKLPSVANLLDDGREYVIKLGLCYTLKDGSLSNRIVPLYTKKETAALFTEGEEFVLRESNIYLIPDYQVPGNCILVVYIATAEDGIRVSEFVELPCSLGSGNIPSNLGVIKYDTLNEFLAITYDALKMRHIDISDLHDLSLESICKKLKIETVFYGGLAENCILEYCDPASETVTRVDDGDELIAGTYRIKFHSALHENQVAYVYCVVTEEMLSSQE